MDKEQQSKPRTWANVIYMLHLAFELHPSRVALQFLRQSIRYGIWIFFSVIFTRYLLQSIQANTPVNDIFTWLGLSMAVLALLTTFVSWYDAKYLPLSNLQMSAALAERLFAQAVRVDLACYEDEEFFNRYTLALKEAETRLPEYLTQLTGSITAGIAATIVMVTLAQINPWMLCFLLFPLIGNFVFGRWLNDLRFRRDIESTKARRRIAYVNRVLYLPDYAKEIRLSHVMRLLLHHLESGYSSLFITFDRYKARAVSANFLFAAFTFLLAFQASFLYGAWLAIVKKSIDIGTFAVLASATVSASWMLLQLSEQLINLFKNTLYIENLRSFLEYEPQIADTSGVITAPRPLQSLEFRHAGFTYRGQTKPVLQDISFSIHHGEKIAIVGHNGAGKTSLVKLMMRLYEPDAGQVLYNGRALKEFNLHSYRSLFGTAFQDYRIFSMTVAENVLLRAPENEADYARVRQALAYSGILDKALGLPKGLDTILTREFADDGAQLSGGELQKIAIARAFATDFELAILDEPSSALDPVSEYRLYETIKQVCRDRTVIFISHRLSSATLADRILMLEQGRIIEMGSHQELMDRNGAYARMFAMQAEHYLEDNYATMAELEDEKS
jgi:ATP-binding cassette subfamily B protein